MKTIITNIVNHKFYSFASNGITVVSVIFIFLEKFIDFDAITFDRLMMIDLVILILFSLDFIMQFIRGGKEYFFNEFGWIDFLAALPVLSPALKGMRIFRFIRAARFLRILRLLRFLRLLKFIKFLTEGMEEDKRKSVMNITSAVLILLIFASVFLVVDRESRLAASDHEAEILLLRLANEKKSLEESMDFLKKEARVKEVVSLEKIQVSHPLSTLFFREGDTNVVRVGQYFVIFSRKHSRRNLDLFEGFLMLGVLSITLGTMVIASKQYRQETVN